MYQTQKALCHFNPPSLRFLRVFCSPSAPSAHSGWVPTAHSAPTAVPHRRSASEGTPQNGGTPQDPRGGALERSPSSGLCPRLPRRASHAAPRAPRRARWIPAAPAPHTADAARPPELPRGPARRNGPQPTAAGISSRHGERRGKSGAGERAGRLHNAAGVGGAGLRAPRRPPGPHLLRLPRPPRRCRPVAAAELPPSAPLLLAARAAEAKVEEEAGEQG